MPGSSIPSFPLAGAILEGFSMPLLLLNDRHAIERKNEFRTRIAAAEACCVPKQTSNDEGRPRDLQIDTRKVHRSRHRTGGTRLKKATRLL
jgi:hypothetical protein